MNKILEIIKQMETSRVSNYVIAGLDSYLLENGKVRIFENSRSHQDQITPHSHRFDFACLVLEGFVINKIWTECHSDSGDFFEESKITYGGEIGNHEKKGGVRSFYSFERQKYTKGQTYSMLSSEIHSIEFSKGAVVLFFEGPEISNESLIIEPFVNGEVIPTYENRDYMFLRVGKQ